MSNPTATYRIQFHKDFTFKDLDRLIPYLKALGIRTIYASPIFAAVPGSTHGYDVTNPLQVNPEIGTEAELIALAKKLKRNGMDWLQDIVPNHMAFHPTNAWLMDVLEKWHESPYFEFFDINFPNALSDQRLMVPFLGEDLETAIEEDKLQLQVRDNKICLVYGESYWPVNTNSYHLVDPAYTSTEVFQQWATTKEAKTVLQAQLAVINQNKSSLRAIADSQFYRLCHWQETESQLNYRRFFTVNGLICLNIQHQQVFDTYHQYIFSLVRLGIFQGLRIDHIDGLADPTVYLDRLRNAVGPSIYIVVEKILAANENMPESWPIEGNTGYDFLAMVNNLFTNRDAEKSFNKLYHEVTHKSIKVAEQIVKKKKAILYEHMQGELDHLVQLFLYLKLADQKTIQKIGISNLKIGIGELLIHCPIYRFYGNQFPLPRAERQSLKRIFDRVDQTPAIELLRTLFLSESAVKNNAQLSTFYQRCMQFSGPLMAKGVEDTLMYTYNRFIGHTEVGDAPDAFGLSIPAFHQKMIHRADHWPLSMNGTSTHDTKRGEDVRARLNVLTDMPEQWRKLALKLQKNSYKIDVGPLGLHQNDAYLIFQTLLGAMSFTPTDGVEMEERLAQYVEKALREAKKRSDWAAPNEAYETAVKQFVAILLDQKQANFKLLRDFLSKIAAFSILNSLAQLLLKFTCPGIPDIYQGTELWDLSLVDPDNRRPVDYELRHRLLDEVKGVDNIRELWESRYTGQIKLWLTQTLLTLRNSNPAIFDNGKYIPVKTEGAYGRHIIAFLRQHGEDQLLIVVPLGLANLSLGPDPITEAFDWKDTSILLPSGTTGAWQNLLTSTSGQKDVLDEGILANDIFNEFPLAILRLKAKETDRGAGVLMSVTSLPSGFGIGDFGPNAYKFVDFLSEAKQTYWQVLPLGPSSALESYSPYSAYSSMAGNTLFISPDLLLSLQLITGKTLRSGRFGDKATVNYKKAALVKERLLHQAFVTFSSGNFNELKEEFAKFCHAEAKWLEDFATFAVLRKHHQYMPWSEWPEGYKLRKPAVIKAFKKQYVSELEEIKWQQFIFFRQWKELRNYANTKGIKLIGDLPFYVAYDSVDVWANPQYFELDEKLERKIVAGVPPDAFNDEGQIWGMPIYNWKTLEAERYSWWIDRLQKNMELFDLLRLDHFRAFHTFWEIKAGEETAKFGRWQDGPGQAFFEVAQTALQQMPFIAEDLGGDMEGPIQFREDLKLPGMKVLQFGFGADMATTIHLPHQYEHHNFVVYTGTHDNNTTKGWFDTELDELGKARLNLYVGKEVDGDNVNEVLIQLALSSTAKLAIYPMQDLIGLDGSSRMNRPATTEENWLWRMEGDELTEARKAWLCRLTQVYNRA